MRGLPTILCRGVARHGIASMPMRARMYGREVFPDCLCRLMAFDDVANMQRSKCVRGSVHGRNRLGSRASKVVIEE